MQVVWGGASGAGGPKFSIMLGPLLTTTVCVPVRHAMAPVSGSAVAPMHSVLCVAAMHSVLGVAGMHGYHAQCTVLQSYQANDLVEIWARTSVCRLPPPQCSPRCICHKWFEQQHDLAHPPLCLQCRCDNPPSTATPVLCLPGTSTS